MGETYKDDEVWRSVPGMEEFYEVSSIGRVRSLPRQVLGKNGVQYLKPGRIMRQQSSGKTGYLTISLNTNMNPVRYYVHRLVLMAFVGLAESGMDGCHKDGNKTNNKLSNLRWDTRSGNLADKISHGTDNRGERHNLAKLTEKDVLSMKRLRLSGLTYRQLGEHFGVHPNTAHRAVTGRRWSHLIDIKRQEG